MRSVEELFRGNEFASSGQDAAIALSLPREAYVSPEFFEYELEAVWRRSWVCVGHVSQVAAPGDYFPITLAGDPLVVVRGTDDRVRVLSSVCRHRSMVMVDDQPGHCDRFTCVFHGWQFGLDGTLLAAPFMKQNSEFDRASQNLPELPVEIWNGFIFTNFVADAEPLAPQLADLNDYFASWRIEELVGAPTSADRFDFNWKIFVENAAECYHCDFLHPGWHDCAPTRNTRTEIFPEHPAAVICTVDTTHPDASFIPPHFTAVFPPLPGLTLAERSVMNFVIVMPNLLLAYYPDGVFYLIMNPLGVKSTAMQFGALYPAEVVDEPSFLEKFEAANAVMAPQLAEDWFACTRVHAGLESTLAARGRMSARLEQSVSHVHRWLLDRYAVGSAASWKSSRV